MNATEYVVPTVLAAPCSCLGRPRAAASPPGSPRGAFRAAGLPVPGHPARRNVYRLTRRQGLSWTPWLDRRIRRRGGELLGHGKLILVDIDAQAAVDGTSMLDALRWLGDAAVEAGGLLDLSATVSVRTPGHPGRGHLPGWHLWYRADPGRPVRTGPLARCHAVELRARGTCPGSPGYVVWSAPGQLPVLPPWIAGLAGPPCVPAARTRTGHGSAGRQARLHGIIGRLLAARRGERNRLLFWASLQVGELVTDGDLDAGAAGQALTDAAAQIGLVREDGQRAVAATIRSGFQRMGVACDPPR